jgi:hypothetical protein
MVARSKLELGLANRRGWDIDGEAHGALHLLEEIIFPSELGLSTGLEIEVPHP